MKYKNEIEEVIKRLLPGSKQAKSKSRKIKIYVNGLYGKLENAEYALNKIKEITQDTIPTEANMQEIDPKVHFYVDSFFAFLYSCFDVLAQILNQNYEDLRRLQLEEKEISFTKILSTIKKKKLKLPINTDLENIILSKYFKNLAKYRNCSTHRHQIYIKKEQNTIAETAGYTSTTGQLPVVQWIICDDPFTLDLKTETPSIKQKRDLYIFSDKMYKNIKGKIDNIVNIL